MKAIHLALAASLFPGVAFAQTPTTPSLWRCVPEQQAECRGALCDPMPVGSYVRIDLVNWSYERCDKVCFGGQDNEWWTMPSGDLSVASRTHNFFLTVMPTNSFMDMATNDGTTSLSSGVCSADYSNGEAESDASLVKSFVAWDAWQTAANEQAQ